MNGSEPHLLFRKSQWKNSSIGVSRITACSLEFLAAYFQPASSVFLSHKSADSTFSRLFSAQVIKPRMF
jgi:hypothetical protein